MRTKVQKWGNSLAVRIPRAFALDTQLEHNSIVEISLVDDQIVVKPVSSRQWSLEQLLSEVTSENIHQEIETGDAVGDEVW
jgi:antitoxin MazE